MRIRPLLRHDSLKFHRHLLLVSELLSHLGLHFDVWLALLDLLDLDHIVGRLQLVDKLARADLLRHIILDVHIAELTIQLAVGLVAGRVPDLLLVRALRPSHQHTVTVALDEA